MQINSHMLHRRKAQSVLAKGIERYQTDKQLLSVAERKVIEPHVDKLITTPQAQKLWRASQTTNWRTATILVATASLVMIGLALSGWWFWQRTQSQAIAQPPFLWQLYRDRCHYHLPDLKMNSLR